MEDIWKNMKEKVDGAPVGSSYASDWEAMNQKIEAQPSLNSPKRKGGFWFRTAPIILLLALSGISVVWLLPDGGSSTNIQNDIPNQVENELLTNPDKEPLSAGEEVHSEIVSDEASGSDKPNEVTEKQTLVEPLKPLVNSKNKVSKSNSQSLNGIKQDQNEYDKTATIETEIVSSRDQFNKPDLRREDVPKIEKTKATPTVAEVVKLETASILDENFTELQEIEEPLDNSILGSKSTKKTGANEVEEEVATASVILDDISANEVDMDSAEVTADDAPIVSNKGEMVEQAPSIPDDQAEAKGLKESGFRLTTLSAGGILLTDYTDNFIGYGGALSVDWQKKGWLISTGLNYTQFNYQTEKLNSADYFSYDTTVTQTTIYRQIAWNDSIWVIQGRDSGGYEMIPRSDSIPETLTDQQVDTVEVTTKNIEVTRVKVSYLEMPIMLGHRFRYKNVGFDIYGGAILNQTLFVNAGESEIQKTFGMDLMLQPALRYYVRPELSVYIRAGLRYGLMGDTNRSQKLYSSFQLGLSYHW